MPTPLGRIFSVPIAAHLGPAQYPFDALAHSRRLFPAFHSRSARAPSAPSWCQPTAPAGRLRRDSSSVRERSIATDARCLSFFQPASRGSAMKALAHCSKVMAFADAMRAGSPRAPSLLGVDWIDAGRDELPVAFGLLARLNEAHGWKRSQGLHRASCPASAKRKIQPLVPPGATRR